MNRALSQLLLIVLSGLVVHVVPTGAQEQPTLRQLQAEFERVARDAEPSVVAVLRFRQQQDGDDGEIDLDGAAECGTGVVVDRRGLILTNRHLLGEVDQSRYVIRFTDKTQCRATVKAADPWSDLAVLQVESSEDARFVPLGFGGAKPLRKGQMVLGLGNPYAIARGGTCSVSWGIISNLRVSKPSDPNVTIADGGLYQYGFLIESDVGLKLATSGGPLLNLDGRMIGLVTTAHVVPGFDLDSVYAIPIDEGVQRVIEQLKRGEEVEYGFLGVELDDLANAGGAGVRVAQVVDGTPAAIAGVRINDLVTHLDDQAVQDADQLLRMIGLKSPGDSVAVRVRRVEGLFGRVRERKVTVRLAKKFVPKANTRVVSQSRSRWRGMVVDYATAIPNLIDVASQIDPEGCVAIVDVLQDSPAWQAGVRTGRFVSHVNGHRVDSPARFYEHAQAQSADASLRVIHNEETAEELVVGAPETP